MFINNIIKYSNITTVAIAFPFPSRFLGLLNESTFFKDPQKACQKKKAIVVPHTDDDGPSI
jgi:hypothetical protein